MYYMYLYIRFRYYLKFYLLGVGWLVCVHENREPLDCWSLGSLFLSSVL